MCDRNGPNWNGQIALEIVKKMKRPVTATEVLQRLELNTNKRLKYFRQELLQTLDGGVRYGYLNKKGRRYFLQENDPRKLPKKLVMKSLANLNTPTPYNIMVHARQPRAERQRSSKPRVRRAQSVPPATRRYNQLARSSSCRRCYSKKSNFGWMDEDGPYRKVPATLKDCEISL